MRASDWTKNKYSRRLKQARQRSGLSQSALADLLGANQSSLSRIEKGSAPRAALALAIVEFIKQQEAGSSTRVEDIINAIASSEELGALVRRIITEI